MTRKTDIAIAVGAALLLAFLPAAAGRRTASLVGKVSDNQGFPLSGTVLQASSPALLNVRRFITADSGRYVFPDLAPGVYTITVEKAEFKTVKAEGIVLDPGATLSLDFKMEPSAVEEEIVVRTPDPGHERSSARLATVLDRDLLTRLPLPRDLASVLSLVPGVVLESGFPVVRASIHGAPVAAANYWVDGANLTNPLDRTLTARVDVDAIEEVVVETAGLPVDSGPGQGAAVNIIHRSGGNVPYADLGFYLTSKGMSRPLWSADELDGSRLVQPRPDMAHFDTSFTAGGPILHDMGWFFSDVRLNFRGQDAPFQAWKDPANYVHSPYTWSDREFYGLFKMSVFATKEFRGSLEASFARAKEPVYAEDLAWNRPEESTRILDLNKTALLRANVAYTLDDRTVLDFNGGYVTGRETLPLNEHGSRKASYSDLVTGRIWGSGPYNDDQKRKRLTANLSLTRFQDRLLGADHQFSLVADYETAKGLSSSWKPDNLVMYYVDGSPYTLGQAVSPSSGNTVGKGQIGFSVIPGVSGGTLGVTRELRRLGVSAGDTLTIGRRVALSLGLRFDHSDTDVLAISKAAAGNAVSVAIGTSIIEPLFGFNPFATGSYGSRDSVITWDSLSPRVGLSVDLFGRGRTFLRGSYARLPEELGLGYIRDLDPVALDRIHQFYWYDENGDGKVDAEDVYQALPENYSIYSTLYTLRVDPSLKAPVTDEWTAGLDHEVVRDFSLAVRYISRTQQGGIGDVLYDPSREQAYYRLEDAPAGWWVPFQTTIPATDAYPATDVTIYLQSTTSPLPFDRIQAVPELTSRYRGLEFSFRKRMSHNWQLSGSAVWSRTTGRSWLAAPLASGLSTAVLNPNSFINVPEDSLSDLDRPLAIRLMGTVRFKHDIFVSLLYRYTSGLPWARTVTIIPPSDWAAANGAVVTPVSVYLEKPGTHRYPATQSTDLRVEKEIQRNGRARWTFYLDVLNVLGNKSSLVDGNDGTWIPTGEGSSSGTHTLSPTYGRALVLNGARTFVLSMKFGL